MNDTLEFPAIVDAAPAARTDVAVATAGAIDLAKIDLTDVALAMYGKWPDEVKAVKANLSTLALDLSTPAKIKDARSLRARLIAEPLAAARKVSTGIKSKMAQTSRAVGAELEKIEAGYAEADALILPKIEARETELNREREEARLIEEARKEKHRTNIEAIRIYVDRASAPGMTAERIARGIEQLQAIPTPTKEAWEEFAVPAADAICQTLDKMRALHAAAVEREAEQARQEARRVENARVAEEQRAAAERLAEQQRQLDAQRAELQRQADEIEAARQRAIAPAVVAAEQGKVETPEASALEAAPITQDAQESGSLPGTPGACASTGAEAAEAPGSGDEGKAAHADECAADTRPPINVGEINRRLPVGLSLTRAGIEGLGITPAGFERGIAYWSESAWPSICEAIRDAMDERIAKAAEA
ncbi:hypothetical protein [Methylibium sp.]|uniref:hypothetical protein n=1 Tax=Methylibium sp. TaxID=2067992 RepID=UPI003D0AB973